MDILYRGTGWIYLMKEDSLAHTVSHYLNLNCTLRNQETVKILPGLTSVHICARVFLFFFLNSRFDNFRDLVDFEDFGDFKSLNC